MATNAGDAKLFARVRFHFCQLAKAIFPSLAPFQLLKIPKDLVK